MIEIPGLLLTLDMFLYLLEPPFPHLEIKGDNAYYQEAAEGFLEVVQLDPGLVPINEVGNVLTNFLCHFRCSNSKLKLVRQGQRREVNMYGRAYGGGIKTEGMLGAN